MLGLRVASLATAISVGTGLWCAWMLANREFPGKRVAGAIATWTIALPSPLLCYYLLAYLGRVWPLTGIGLVTAGVVSAMPLVVRAARTAFGSLDPGYAKAARSLGASDWRVFSRVELPLVFRPVLAVTALAFARVFAELTAAMWIAEPRP
jgi:molybdate transport system permease protein